MIKQFYNLFNILKELPLIHEFDLLFTIIESKNSETLIHI